MAETDAEFVSDMEWLHSHDREAALPPEKLIRLFALARRGAEMPEPGFMIYQDGHTEGGQPMWCAVYHDFVNLQESPAAFHAEPWTAIKMLTDEYPRKGSGL